MNNIFKKTIKFMSLSLVFTSLFFMNPNSTKSTRLNGESVLGLKVINTPYITKLSLGDELYTEGLVIELTTSSGSEIIDDYDLSGHNPNDLGIQAIQVTNGSYISSFDVFVTNENVRNTIVSTSDLFISEIVFLDNNNFGLELYNNTNTQIDLSNYFLTLNYPEHDPVQIALPTETLDVQDAYTISSPLATLDDLVVANYKSGELDFTDIMNVTLTKETNSLIVDNFEFIPDLSWFNPPSEFINSVVRKHYRNNQPSSTFDSQGWYITSTDTSDFGSHSVIEDIMSVEDQAKAFARYVMFGAGMFAAGRVNEAYQALKSEFELMSGASKAYFINNKNVTVQGYNETNKFVTVTFREAQGRISVLASRSGNVSFVPSTNTFNLSFDNLAPYLLIGLVVLAFGSYIIFRVKTKKSS